MKAIIFLMGLVVSLALTPRAQAATSAFCHQVDGAFTDCAPGAEWSDVTPASFLDGGSYVYADQNPSHTQLYLMYDYLLGSCPLDPTKCGKVEFDVLENGKLDHYQVFIGGCAKNGFDVFVNGIKLPEAHEEGIAAAVTCGPSPNKAEDHQIYELSVPLVLVYAPDDPRFWSSGFPAPPPDPAPDADFDGDGVPDSTDNCPFAANPGQEDVDQDGVGDVCAPCPAADGDGDGVPDVVDNCPTVANPTQADSDDDGAGNQCDPCPKDPDDFCDTSADNDHDGFGNDEDNCPGVANPDQTDTDGDGFGDACDPCPLDDTNTCEAPPECRECVPDSDADGVPDDIDNCPTVPNADQGDRDLDEVGDLCDPCPDDEFDLCDPPADDDGDGIPNDEDNCPSIVNPGQEDSDGDGFGDACDPCLFDDLNACIGCVGRHRSARSVPSSAGLIQTHASILDAHSDGSTTNDPRGLCGSPEKCSGDDPTKVLKFVKTKYGLLLKCAKNGTFPCDLTKAQKVGPISTACRANTECLVDGSMELMLGSNNPPTGPVTDKCALAVGKNGIKFVTTFLKDHLKGKDAAIPGAKMKAQGSTDKKCDAVIGGPAANLGGDCLGKTGSAAVSCVFERLGGTNPLP